MRRLSVDSQCKGTYTCPAVWLDDDEDFLVIVGHPVNGKTFVNGQAELRIERAIVTASGFDAVGTAYRDDEDGDYVLVVGESVPAEAVLLPNGMTGVAADEIAVRVKHQIDHNMKVG